MHVSGHGYQEDLKLMLTLMKPKYLIPIHGEYRMLHHHRLLAESVGVEEENTFIIKNGDVVDFSNSVARQTGQSFRRYICRWIRDRGCSEPLYYVIVNSFLKMAC